MRNNLVLVGLLCSITWMSSGCAVVGPAVPDCCSGYSNTIAPLNKVVNYTIQLDDVCAIKAFVFKTESGRIICSDPKSGWARKAKQAVDKKTLLLVIKEHNEEGSTSDITPTTASTTTKKPRRKRGHRQRKRQLRMNVKRRRKCD
ncbi:hypothetical protein Q5P01_022318 [Channa striata]|uniref:Chemokine interleukin-8-like domain-containing protein n=1 Tax=Channa striata TaxID=64152 RepID=A0AA88LLR1_CHASR|nr:hypothetical protein Q5P01_022318 [Channa striata]